MTDRSLDLKSLIIVLGIVAFLIALFPVVIVVIIAVFIAYLIITNFRKIVRKEEVS